MSADMNRFPKIGEVYYMQFDGHGNEQRGWRPCLVFQNNIGNKYSPNLIVLPLTSKIKKTNQPTHTFLPSDATGLPRDSIVLCENPKCISKEKLGSYITTIPSEYMAQVAISYLLATSALSLVKLRDLPSLWQLSASLNVVAA